MMEEQLRVLEFYDGDETSAAVSTDKNTAAWQWRWRRVALDQQLRDF